MVLYAVAICARQRAILLFCVPTDRVVGHTDYSETAYYEPA